MFGRKQKEVAHIKVTGISGQRYCTQAGEFAAWVAEEFGIAREKLDEAAAKFARQRLEATRVVTEQGEKLSEARDKENALYAKNLQVSRENSELATRLHNLEIGSQLVTAKCDELREENARLLKANEALWMENKAYAEEELEAALGSEEDDDKINIAFDVVDYLIERGVIKPGKQKKETK